MDERVVKGKAADEILEEAHERFTQCVEAERANREASLDDLEFLTGKQWTEKDKKLRDGRPCLTINRLPAFVRQVTNEQRMTRPAIDVIPADAKASAETADVMQGIVRYIERTSRARLAYDQSFQYAVSCGIGHFRVTTEYIDDTTFDQDILIKPIANPFSVYRDPYSNEPDHADDMFTFVTEFVDCDEFKERYGFEPTTFEDAATGDEAMDWYDGDEIMVAEYWRVLVTEGKLIALSDGSTQTTPLTDLQKEYIKAGMLRVLNERTTQTRTVEQYLLTFDKVIKKSEWRGKYIPILTSVGEQYNVAGKNMIASLIRYAKDPARMYNYQASAEVELIGLQPKAPWVGAEGQFDGHEEAWTRANRDNVPYLEYSLVPDAPPPQRQPFAGVPQGVREARMAAAEDIKATLGMFDASLGARSNETSGVAIKARQAEGDTGTFHFVDNHARAIEHCGRILVDLIPKIYDTPRVIRIVGPTDQEDVAIINQMFVDPNTGEEKMHKLDLGRYEVAVRVGPSFESKRQEMVNAVVELSSRNPKILDVAGDLIFQNLDFPHADKIAERLAVLLPPELGGPQKPQQPPEAVLAAQAMAQGQVQAADTKARADLAKAQFETTTINETDRFRILVDAAVKLMIAEQNNETKQAAIALDAKDMQVKHLKDVAAHIDERARGMMQGFQ